MYELVLVSESPRRRQILFDAGFLFRVGTVKISEIIEENVNLEDSIMNLAQLKASAYLSDHKYLKKQDILLLSADTMVILEGRALGKPKNPTEARRFLRDLSGKRHVVMTGFFIHNLHTEETYRGIGKTEVWFRALSEDEIQAYVDSGEPLDKAGAYAIQGAGRNFVADFRGSMKNVIGLPLEQLENVFLEKGWHVTRRSASTDN